MGARRLTVLTPLCAALTIAAPGRGWLLRSRRWASTLDKDKLHEALEDAVIVIDEQELEESRRDPRVHALLAQGDALMAQLDAEHANF